MGLAYARWPALGPAGLYFVADGSVWEQDRRDGPPRRLTDRKLRAREPIICAAGRWLGFAGLSGAVHELWLLDLQRGGARPLSAEALPLRVCGWHPDGRLLAAWRGLVQPMLWTLRLVDPHSGEHEEVPLHDAGDGCFVTATRLIFVRGGLQDDHARRYRGGAMRQLWTVDLAQRREAVPLKLPAEALEGECWAPRFDGERLHFLGDSGGTPRLWTCWPDGGAAAPWQPGVSGDGSPTRRISSVSRRQAEFSPREAPACLDDVETYAVRQGRVIVAVNGFLMEPPADEALALPLVDDQPGKRPDWDRHPLRRLEAVRPHASAGALLRCRGQLWWLPPPAGGVASEPVALPWPGGRAGAMAWAADGRSVFAVSDATGEQEIWRLAPAAAPTRLTDDGGAERTGLWPSPCGRWLLHADARHRLWLDELPPASGSADTVQPRRAIGASPDEQQSGPVNEAAWAPDGRAVVLVRPIGAAERMRLELWRLEGGRLVHEAILGDPSYPCFSPAWSTCGGWIFYLSARHFDAPDPHPWGDRNTGVAFPKRVCVDAQALVEGATWPWSAPQAPAASFLTPVAPTRAGERRTVPIPADAHARLFASASGLCTWVKQPRRSGSSAGGLWRLGFGPTAVARAVPRALQLYAQAGEVALGRSEHGGDDAPLCWLQPGTGTEDTPQAALPIGWRVPVDPPAEWAQHLRDAWRHRRERVYDPGRHDATAPWPLQRALAALPRVRERSEVDALLAELLRDLDTLHSFVHPPAPDTADAAAFLGMRTVIDGESLRVAAVLRGSDTDPAALGPAAAAGVREGDRLLALAGQVLDVRRDGPMAAARWLVGRSGRPLPITLQRPDGRCVGTTVQPHDIMAELALRHADQVRRTRERVAAAGAGQLGYVHLAAMRQADLEHFVRDAWADPLWRGLVLDLRGNRGGNIDSWLISMLARRPWAWWSRRYGAQAPNPPGCLPEPLAVLIDAQTYSDGETLAAGLQRLGRGRLFGSRSSGAGVWLRKEPNLLDGGTVAVGEFGQFDADGWLIEGHGVEPHETVCPGPRAAAAGHDAVLERALQWLQQRIAEVAPPPPVPRNGRHAAA